MNIGIILAAGIGERFGSTIHKQYLKLNGKEVVYYTISEMRNSNCFDEIIVVVDHDEFLAGYIEKKYDVKCIPGGDKRNKSVKNALDYIKKNYNAQKILIHDCVRLFIKNETYKRFISLLDKYDAVAMSMDITDSLVTTNGEFINRRDYLLIQTPEAFKFEKIYADFDANSNDTAIVNQLKDKSNINLLKSTIFNFKITYPQDLFLAEQLMRINYMHTSESQDIPKISGKVLLLGGSGGVGQALISEFKKLKINFYAPQHEELDLFKITVNDFIQKCPFKPDIIINAAATYADDSYGLIETYEKIFDINLRSNLVLIEYAKTLEKPVNLVMMSSSSSTRGRENLTNYSAAKAALNSVIESQGTILHKIGININGIVPEKINTPLIKKLHKQPANPREFLNVDEIIGAIFKCCTTTDFGKLFHIRKGL